MAHHAMKSAYEELVERLNHSPQGVAPKEILYQILKLLFTEKDAELCARLPIKPFTPETAAALWKMNQAEAEKILEQMADRQILLDFRHKNGTMSYVLPPPVAGFFEFSLMRVRKDFDQKLLAELFHQYLSVEDDFMTQLLGGCDTQFGRILVNEPALSDANKLEILDYERASEIIKTARHIGVGMCFCRHKAQHLGKACSAPMEICMSLNVAADSLIRHNCCRRIDVKEGLDLLQQAWDLNLVQFAENNRRNVSFICNCCHCCCEALNAFRKFGTVKPVHTNFIARFDDEACNGCGRCTQVCPVEAVAMVNAHDPVNQKRQKAKPDEAMCLGCGVCVRVCAKKAISLESRPGRVITPLNSVHRMVIMAIEREKLQNLVFDNPHATGHRALGAILGTILRLPALKQALANKQLQSRYIEKLCARSKL